MSHQKSSLPSPRYRIERARGGYRVVGPDLLIWEPTVGEAMERRAELETPGWRHPQEAHIGGQPALPFDSIVYGPISSRRLGNSLGVSLTPPRCRLCSYDCVYCSYGDAPPRSGSNAWPTADEVEAALDNAAGSIGALDSITISGHGEATLHPELPLVVDRILAAARRSWPRVPVRILTNGSQAVSPTVRSALDRLDERIVKLDANFERVCRPTRGHPPGARLLGLSLLRDVSLQSCFIEGSVSNTDSETVTEWIELVSEIGPRAVQIYTIDQPPATADIRPVSPSRLEEIACQLRGRTGIEARVYG